jgi:uncharacterized protein YndB with AHSA1/START domain
MTSTTRSTEHATFTVVRQYNAAPEQVWSAWADEAAKREWFTMPSPEIKTDYRLDFGVDEHARTTLPDGTTYDFDATYIDVVEGERFVYTYDMHCNGERISVSVATVEIRPEGRGSAVAVTEQGVYLDGLDQPQFRETGIAEQLEKLAGVLDG